VLAMIAPPAMADDDKPFTIHGEVRIRSEYTSNTFDLSDTDSADNTTYWPYRVRLAAEGRFGKNVTAWIEFQNAGIFGAADATFFFGPFSTVPPSRNGSDVAGIEGDGAELYQGNIKVKGLWSDNFSVTFGRQEITAGTELLLGDLDFYSGISHDGLTGTFDFKKWDLMLLYTRVQQSDLGIGFGNYLPNLPPDQIFPIDAEIFGGTTDFMGGYATFGIKGGHNFDIYLFDLKNHEAAFDVMTYGARYSKNNPEGLFWNVEYALQSGDVSAVQSAGGDVLEAWLGFHFGKKHAIWGKYAAASGDDPGSADMDAFIPLFGDYHNRLGRGDWFQLSGSATALGGGSNGIDAYAVGYTGNYTDKAEWGVAYWDYSAGEVGAGLDDNLGQAIDLYVSYKYSDNLTFSASGSQFSPDEGLAGVGGPDDSVYRIYGQARLRF